MAERPSGEAIDNVLNVAQGYEDASRDPYPGMSYLLGVADALRWVQGSGDGETPTAELDPEADGVQV